MTEKGGIDLIWHVVGYDKSRSTENGIVPES